MIMHPVRGETTNRRKAVLRQSQTPISATSNRIQPAGRIAQAVEVAGTHPRGQA
jgi:hypothetical protein